MKNLTLTIIAVMLFWANANALDKPIELSMFYDQDHLMLTVNIERHSKDEIKNTLKKLIVYKEPNLETVEDLVQQNHLNQIIKKIPYFALDGETIHVDLYYGKDSVIKNELKVKIKKEKEQEVKQEVTAKTNIEVKDLPLKVSQEKKAVQRSVLITNEKPSYGYSNLGYKSKSLSYGYSMDENDKYNKVIENYKPFGYEMEHEVKGYQNEGSSKKGHKGNSHLGSGYEGDENFFGRTTYDEGKFFK